MSRSGTGAQLTYIDVCFVARSVWIQIKLHAANSVHRIDIAEQVAGSALPPKGGRLMSGPLGLPPSRAFALASSCLNLQVAVIASAGAYPASVAFLAIQNDRNLLERMNAVGVFHRLRHHLNRHHVRDDQHYQSQNLAIRGRVASNTRDIPAAAFDDPDPFTGPTPPPPLVDIYRLFIKTV
jgi:hypothetical protein